MAAPDLLLAFDDPNTATGGQFAHRFLNCFGVVGYSATLPDSAATSVAGDFEGIIYLNGYKNNGTNQCPFGKWDSTQQSYLARIDSSNRPTLNWASSAGTESISMTCNLDIGASFTGWLRYSFKSNDGGSRSFQAYTSTDAYSESVDPLTGVNWSALGVKQTSVSGTTSVFDGTSLLRIGSFGTTDSSPLVGGVSRFTLYSGVTLAVDAKLSAQPIGTTTFTESSSNAATVTVAGPVVADSSGNNRDGRAVNGVTLGQPGKKGLAATFDGVNDYVRVANWGNLVRGGGGWFKPAAIGAKQSLISQTTGGTSAGGFDFYITTAGKLELKAYDATPTASTITGGTTLVAGTWYHLFFTYDGTNLNLFVNAVADATPVAAITLTLSTIDVLVGAQNPTTPTSFYGGLADDVRIYSTAPSLGEIAVLASPSNRILSPLMMPGIFN